MKNIPGTFRFSISAADRCPVYEVGDEFDLEDIRLVPSHGKPVCMVMAGDMVRSMTEGAAPSNLVITCTGCGGTATARGTPLSDLFGSLSHDQQRRVEVLVETLGRFSLFKTLNEEELRTVLPEMKAGDFEPGAIVVKQGEIGRYLYIVESGSVDVLAGEHDEVLLTTLGQGEIFGEMSLLSGTPVSATVRVRQESRLLAIDGHHFTRMVVRYPSLQIYLFRLLTHRLRETNSLKETQPARGIRGNLDDMQLAELLQALHTARRSGRLDLLLPGGQATVMIRTGNIVGIDYDKRQNAEGFFELLKQNDGTFVFSPDLPSEYAETPQIGDFMHLLMEGLVRIDEEGHRNSGESDSHR
jgi:CRP-like cAMP-binding protein